MILFTAPEKIVLPQFHARRLPKVFLGGSIEQGKATMWQNVVIDMLKDEDCIVFNPRRNEWDASLEQSSSNPVFAEQVNWELDRIDESDIVVLYFDPATQSPITLLEFGYIINNPDKSKMIYCPPGYYRKGNIDVTANRRRIFVWENEFEFMKALKSLIHLYSSRI